MHALREALPLPARRRTISLTRPKACAGQHVQVTVRPAEEPAATPAAEPPHGPRRAPPPWLRGTRLTGDTQAPAIAPQDRPPLR